MKFDRLTHKSIEDFVEAVISGELSSVKEWLSNHEYSPEAFEWLVLSIEGHFRALDYLDSHAPGEDFTELLNRFHEALPKFDMLLLMQNDLRVSYNLTKDRKPRCPQGYFTPVAERIIKYLSQHHAGKYSAGKWIGSDKHKKVIKELFYVARGKAIFELDHLYTGESLSSAFLKATGILYSPKRFNEIKKYPDFKRDINSFSQLHNRF